jgi:short subunit dehydrogenase-like uncharacterized protein
MSERRPWLLYGATGFTGTLLAEAAVRRGHRPLLAGRSGEKLAPLAARLQLPFVTLSLEDERAIVRVLQDTSLVVHAAGPFVETAAPMRNACLEARCHYLDLTGELPVLQETFAADARARDRGVVLLGGVGFDVVATDCLAAYVAQKIAPAHSVEIALSALGTPSAGTAKSALGMLEYGGCIRHNGRLQPLPLGQGVHRVRLLSGETWAIPVPLGDLVTAFYSTQAANITTSLAIPDRIATFLRVPVAASASTFLTQLLSASDRIRGYVTRQLERRIQGPDERARNRGRSSMWARAENASGGVAEAWLETIDGYAYTMEITLNAVERVLNQPLSGALTPSQAFGVDFALSVAGSRRVDALPV